MFQEGERKILVEVAHWKRKSWRYVELPLMAMDGNFNLKCQFILNSIFFVLDQTPGINEAFWTTAKYLPYRLNGPCGCTYRPHGPANYCIAFDFCQYLIQSILRSDDVVVVGSRRLGKYFDAMLCRLLSFQRIIRSLSYSVFLIMTQYSKNTNQVLLMSTFFLLGGC